MATTSIHSASNTAKSYVPLRPLGRGSSGAITLALAIPQGYLCALKCSVSPAKASLLLREIHILQSLDSPFVIKYLGSEMCPHNSIPSFHVPEFMDGGSLADVVRRSGGRLQEQLVRQYTRSIVQGLCYLHSRGIVHCDIKEQNILVGSSGVKIADFGAAKRINTPSDESEGDHPASEQTEFSRTLLWMAPEQAFPSDICSLGCTVLEMLQGRPPWGHLSDIAAAMYKIGCSEESPPMPESISADGKGFLLNCLRRDPADRWTAAQFLNHRFCRVETADLCKDELSSPRGILDNFFSSPLSSESTPDSDYASETSESFEETAKDAFSSDERRWITVKRSARPNRDYRSSLTEGQRAGTVQVKRACDVSFAAAMFLKTRKPVG
ncbi:hypothetical protein KP509_1Z123900 [Ceratopteris richardii]|nr:hypothetical protein KP509_1Z123900 [Ceratopteris richardii]